MNEASNSQIPAPLETRLLRGALLDGDAAVEAYRAWHAEVDVDALDGGSQRMLPLLAANLARIGYEDDFTPQLHGHRRQALAMNAHRIGVVRPALRALEAAGIATMVLKGTALVASGLSELGLRPIGDVDVLVRPADRARAIDVLLADGWEVDTYPAWYVKRVFWRTVPAWVLRKGLVQLDLHWGALHLVRDPVAERPLWEHATTGSLGGEPVRVPSVEDQAMQTWLHAAEWCGLPPLRWAADAATVVRTPGFDWDRVVATAIDQRVALQTRSALDYLAGELDQPIPDAARRRLHAERVPWLERREHAARAIRPADRGRLDAAVVELQDHRRQDVELLARPARAGVRDLRRERREAATDPDRELHDLRAGPLVLDRDADPLDSPLHGWSFPEPHGRWTVGRAAALAVRVEPGTAVELKLDLSALVGGRSARGQRVTIAAGGQRTVQRFDAAADAGLRPREVSVAVPPTADGIATVTFQIASPRSPATIGLSADERKLGVLLRSVQLTPAQPGSAADVPAAEPTAS